MKRYVVREKKNPSEWQKVRKEKLNKIRETMSRRIKKVLREENISEIDFAIQMSQVQEQFTELIELMTMTKLVLARLLTDNDDTISVNYIGPEDEM